MPTWKLKTDTEPLFYHLCSECNEKSTEALLKADWVKIRDGDPVSCNECSRKCALTLKRLWGAEDTIRYAECQACPESEICPLKGRHYC